MKTNSDTEILRNHCNKLKLGDKMELTETDKANLQQSLEQDGRLALAKYVEMHSVDELTDLLVNTIYG
jgi:hypothetical protein